MTLSNDTATGPHLPLRGERLAGSVALVSGAGFAPPLIGIGAAIAILFAAQGATVGIFDADPTRAANTCREIDQLGGTAVPLPGDLRDPDAVAAAVAALLDRCGRLDTLVNNAAIACRGDVRDVASADWRNVIDVNLTGPMLLSQAAAPALARQGGSIINLSSIAAMRGFGSAAYSASKAGLEGLTRDMAATLGGSGIRVNAIVPGFLFAPMGANPMLRETRRRANALDTEGTAWDAAFAALFLASAESRWITGISLPVDAGAMIMPPRPPV